MRILIAEDDSTLSDALERSLRMSGHAVDRAADGESALQLLDTGEFDLLILDHGLPRLDGTEVLERARQLSGRLAVILISAAEDAALRVRRRGLGVDAFLIKPFGLDALDAAIQVLVRGTAALPALRIAMFGPLRCDAVGAWLNGDLLALPPPVLGVLQLLVEHGGSVVSSESIFTRLSACRPDGGSPNSRRLYRVSATSTEPIRSDPSGARARTRLLPLTSRARAVLGRGFISRSKGVCVSCAAPSRSSACL